MSASAGRCPGCQTEGRVGHACERATCRKAGLHAIPAASTDAVPGTRRLRDARVGRVIGAFLLVDRLRRVDADPVYRALQLPALLEGELALVPVDRAPEVHDNLLRQAMALARLDHPNVVRLVAFGSDPLGTYLVTSPVASGPRSETLADLLDADPGRPLPLGEACALIESLVAALEALAEGHLVHGEIRPRHVLVRALPGHPRFVQLAGFVRVPAADAADRAHANPVGDLVWAPPEQLARHALGATTDAYAVAAVAFRLLFGRSPFPDDDRDALARAKADPAYDPAEGLDAAAPRETLDFFRQALAPDPSDRPRDATAFTTGLGQALAAVARRKPDASWVDRVGRPAPAEPTVVVARMPDEPAPDDGREAWRAPTVQASAFMAPAEGAHEGRAAAVHEGSHEGRAAAAGSHERRAAAAPDRTPPRRVAPAAPRPTDDGPTDDGPADSRPHAGTTSVLKTDDLAALASQRPVPRMHGKRGS